MSGNDGKLIELLSRQMGQNSVRDWVDVGEANVAGPCWAIQVLTDCVFDALTDGTTDLVAGVLSGITIPAGTALFGQFTVIGVASGVAVCYTRST